MKKDALFNAIVKEDIQLVKGLIDSGIDISAPGDETDFDGNTPILYTLSRNKNVYPTETKLKIIRLLLDAGADLQVLSAKYNESVMSCAIGACIEAIPLLLDKGVRFASSLHEAVYMLNEPTTLKSLLISGISVDVRDSSGNTPLMYAIQLDKLTWVKALVENGADLSARNNSRSTALLMAVATDNFSIARWFIIEKKAPVPKFDSNDYGDSLAIWAAYLGNLPMLRCLLEHGASLDVVNRHGFTPLLAACLTGHLTIVRFLVEEKQRSLVSEKTKNSENALISAINKNNDIALITWLLDKNPAFIAESGIKAFNTAVWNGRIDVMDLLIQRGVQVDKGELSYNTLFFHAAWTGQIDVGSWIVTRDKNVLMATSEDGTTGLLYACQRGHFAFVEWLLKTYPIDLNTTNNQGFNSLICAVKSGNFALVKWLVGEKQSSVNIKAKNGDTALSIAARNGFFSLFEWLLAQGATFEAVQGGSILMWAIEKELFELVKFIIETKPRLIEEQNQRGYTPFLKAIQLEEFEIAKLLAKQGANLTVTTYQKEDALLMAILTHQLKIIKWLFEETGIDFSMSFQRQDYLAYAKMTPMSATEEYLSKHPERMAVQQTAIPIKSFLDYMHFCIKDENKSTKYTKNMLGIFESHYSNHINLKFLQQLLEKSQWQYHEWAIKQLRRFAIDFNIFPLLIKGLKNDTLPVKLSVIDTINSLPESVYKKYNTHKTALIEALKICGTQAKEKQLRSVIENTLKTTFGENFKFATNQDDQVISSERAIAENNLLVFANALGLSEIKFDENNTCILGIDDEFSLHLTYEPNSKRLYIYSPLMDGLPKNNQYKLKLYEELLQGSMLGGKMAGGGVGMAPKEQLILMHCTLDMEAARSEDLNSFVSIYVEAVEQWRKLCTSYKDAEKPEGSAKNLISLSQLDIKSVSHKTQKSEKELLFACAKNNLSAFGHELKLNDLEFDENNTCILGIDDTFSLHLTYEPNSSCLYLYSPLLDHFPKNDETKLKLYEMLLKGSMLGGEMAGGGVGIALAEELILLHTTITLNKNSPATLLKAFAPLYVETAEKWRKICADCCAKDQVKQSVSLVTKTSKGPLAAIKEFFERTFLNFNFFTNTFNKSTNVYSLSSESFDLFAKSQNFNNLLAQIVSRQRVDVNMEELELSISQVAKLVEVVRNCSWIETVSLGKNLEWANAEDQEYIAVRFNPAALQEAKQLVLEQKVDKLITLTKSSVFYEVFGYNPWHLVALTGNEAIVDELKKKNVLLDELDKKGNSPIHLAEQGNYRELAKRLRLIKDEQDIQQLLIESTKVQEEQRNFIMRQTELRKELAQLITTDNNEYFRLYYDLSVTILAIKKLVQVSSIKTIDVATLKFPGELLQFVDTADERKKLFDLLSKKKDITKIFKPLNELIKRLSQSLKNLVKEPNLHIAVERLIFLYEAYLEKITEATSLRQFEFLLSQTPPSIVMGAGLKSGFLLKNYDTILTNFSNKRDNTYGTSNVYQIGNIHFKRKPHAPGIEFIVSALGRIIANQGTTPTELFKIIDARGIPFVYLASRSVRGKELDKVLRYYPDAISKIDTNNFSAIVVLGLLTDPQDGKPDNYMVEFEADQDKRIKHIEIIGIDNDIAFAEIKVRDHSQGQMRHFVNIRNVVYFFPQMYQPIGALFRENLLKRSPEMIMLEWLVLLYMKNKEYQQLLEEGIFSKEEYYGDGGKTDKLGLQLPIRFLPGTTEKLYLDKLIPLFKLIENPAVTLMTLFELLEPALAQHYKLVAKRYPNDIYAAINSLYRESIEDIKEQQWFEKELEYGNTAVMTEVALKTAGKFEFEENRNQTIQQAIIAWLKVVNYDKFSPQEARIFYQVMKQIDFLFSGQRGLIHIAAEQRLSKLAEFLLKNELESPNQTDNAKTTPLHISASLGDVSMLELLYTYGGQLDAKDKNDRTPKDKAMSRSQKEVMTWFATPTKKMIIPRAPTNMEHRASVLSQSSTSSKETVKSPISMAAALGQHGIFTQPLLPESKPIVEQQVTQQQIYESLTKTAYNKRASDC